MKPTAYVEGLNYVNRKRKAIPAKASKPTPPEDDMLFVTCVECGVESGDAGRNVACEECGCYPMPYHDDAGVLHEGDE